MTRLRIAIAGLTHDHVKTFHRAPHERVELVGVAEPNRGLLEAYGRAHDLDASLLFTELGEMLDATRPEAVAAFGSIREHLQVVEAAAPRGVHVMVEKPLAISIEHAQQMAALARRHNIHLLTNYETSWYATTQETLRIVERGQQLGQVLKVVVHDGHRGPVEIGCSPEFLGWLTDPVENGAGALVDFGCYGANLMTHFMGDTPPAAVTTVARQFKPKLYPRVDDDATIIVDYPRAQAIIQGSWNWAVSRKDIEVYGQRGYLVASDRSTLRSRSGDTEPERVVHLPALPSPFSDPFDHLAAVVRGELVLKVDDLAELDNNLRVVRILDAAKLSAREGRTVRWEEFG